MNNSEIRIPKEFAADVFALAAHLYAQENQNYSLEELIEAGGEVQIPPELIRQALLEIKARQTESRQRLGRLRLILMSGVTGAAMALFGLSAYNNTIGRHSTSSERATQENLQSGNYPPDHLNAQQPPPIVFPREDDKTLSGVVEQYLLNPEGKVDGLLLENGLQVRFPPHMGDRLVAMVAPRSTITVVGTNDYTSEETRQWGVGNGRCRIWA